MLKQLYLDFDGVIHRTATAQLRRAFAQVVNKQLELPASVVDSLFSSIQAMPSQTALGLVFEWIGITDVDQAVESVHHCDPDGWTSLPDASGMDQSVVELVRVARSNGVGVSVLSGASPDSERARLALAALAEFDVHWLRTGGASKSDPLTYRRVLETHGVGSPSDCVLVDDSIIAVAAAAAIGIRSFYSAFDPPPVLGQVVRNWEIVEIQDQLFGKELKIDGN